MEEIRISRTKIDETLWSIKSYLMKKDGYSLAEREMYPLNWYINTGRASAEFLRKMFVAKPYMIGRQLQKGGTDSEVINRVKSYIGYKDEV